MQAVAIGLPVCWNYVVKSKWDAWRAARALKEEEGDVEAEALAVRIIVDERRKERGLPPYDFDRIDAAKAGARDALWSHVEQRHKALQALERSPSNNNVVDR